MRILFTPGVSGMITSTVQYLIYSDVNIVTEMQFSSVINKLKDKRIKKNENKKVHTYAMNIP